ncbi:MAG: hypothetical protein DSY37_02780 [Hyperthermus sp.]|nr:MAG: hypothetical protein DSY37_02780 [Hyperthermus sp.]
MRVLVRVYRHVEADLKQAVIDAFRIVEEESVGRDFFDVVEEYTERYKGTSGILLEIIGVEEKSKEEKYLYAYTTLKAPLIFPRPALLKRLWLIARSGKGELTLQRQLAVREKLYVHVGRVRVSSDGVWAVIVETDKGARLVKPRQG